MEGEDRILKAGCITSLMVQKKHPDRISVFLDGAFAFGIHQELVLEFSLKKGRNLSVPEQRQIIQKDCIHRAKAKALHYLSYRARSEEEVRRKLQRSGFDETVCGQVLIRLRELGYINDADYALTYARGRFEYGNYGPNRIRYDLKKRGVNDQNIEEALAAVFRDEDGLVNKVREQAAKRWVHLAREGDLYKRRRKLFDFLFRRGFPYDVIREAVEEIAGSDD